jgi:hypothetical protein
MLGFIYADNSFVENTVFFHKENMPFLKILFSGKFFCHQCYFCPDIRGRYLKTITPFIGVAQLNQTSFLLPTIMFWLTEVSANWSQASRAEIIW